MPARMLIELGDGKKLFFGGRGPARGLGEVGIADDIVTATRRAFSGALGTLAEIVTMLEQSLERIERRPDKVEVEFRATLSGECDLWIVSGEGEAEFKVTLGWDKTE